MFSFFSSGVIVPETFKGNWFMAVDMIQHWRIHGGEAVWVATMSFSLLGLLRRGLAKMQYCTRQVLYSLVQY